MSSSTIVFIFLILFLHTIGFKIYSVRYKMMLENFGINQWNEQINDG